MATTSSTPCSRTSRRRPCTRGSNEGTSSPSARRCCDSPCARAICFRTRMCSTSTSPALRPMSPTRPPALVSTPHGSPRFRWVDGGRLGLYFVELGTPPRPTNVIYDRAASAMAMAAPELFDWTIAADTDFLHISGITLGLSDSCRDIARQAMEAARSRGAVVTFDVNYRQRLWGPDAAAAAARDIAPLVDVLICTAEDARDLFGASGEPERVLTHLKARLGVGTIVLTLGPEGSIATRAGATIRRSGHTVQTVDRVGTGDAFVAGLIRG
ncbi:MAG: sugar kinase, partial [Chloroflexi bacterium]